MSKDHWDYLRSKQSATAKEKHFKHLERAGWDTQKNHPAQNALNLLNYEYKNRGGFLSFTFNENDHAKFLQLKEALEKLITLKDDPKKSADEEKINFNLPNSSQIT